MSQHAAKALYLLACRSVILVVHSKSFSHNDEGAILADDAFWLYPLRESNSRCQIESLVS